MFHQVASRVPPTRPTRPTPPRSAKSASGSAHPRFVMARGGGRGHRSREAASARRNHLIHGWRHPQTMVESTTLSTPQPGWSPPPLHLSTRVARVELRRKVDTYGDRGNHGALSPAPRRWIPPPTAWHLGTPLGAVPSAWPPHRTRLNRHEPLPFLREIGQAGSQAVSAHWPAMPYGVATRWCLVRRCVAERTVPLARI